MPISTQEPLQQQRQQRLLQFLELKSSVFYAGKHCGNWRSSPPQAQRCAFHIVLSGQCAWRTEAQSEAIPLQAGEGVVFLQPMAHELMSWPPTTQEQEALPVSAHVVCGYLEFATPFSGWLINQLPTVLSFSVLKQPQLVHVLALLRLELGGSVIEFNDLLLHKLCELLLCYVLQEALSMPVDAASYGMMGLAQDPSYGVVLDALWQHPEKTWSIEKMAALVHVSPASFHRRFKLLTGMGPAQLLLLIRLHWAKQYLRQDDTLEIVAEKVGYSSASALSQAFRRHMGLNPAQWRNQSLFTSLD